MKESDFQKKVITYLKQNDIWFIKYWGGGVFTKEGVPDILACIDGILHGIELKTDVGIESKLQAYHLNAINHNRGEGYILRPTKTKGIKYPEFNYHEMAFDDWKEWLKCSSVIRE